MPQEPNNKQFARENEPETEITNKQTNNQQPWYCMNHVTARNTTKLLYLHEF